MSVRRFRSVEEMGEPSRLERLDPKNLRLAFGLAEFARRMRPLAYVAGVHKYRSHEDLLRARERWEREASRASRSTS